MRKKLHLYKKKKNKKPGGKCLFLNFSRTGPTKKRGERRKAKDMGWGKRKKMRENLEREGPWRGKKKRPQVKKEEEKRKPKKRNGGAPTANVSTVRKEVALLWLEKGQQKKTEEKIPRGTRGLGFKEVTPKLPDLPENTRGKPG